MFLFKVLALQMVIFVHLLFDYKKGYVVKESFEGENEGV